MSITTAALLGLFALALVYAILIYNGLISLRHSITKNWANIDVLLKQRHDELPKLVEVCRQYQQFEQNTLSRVTEARARIAAAREAHDVNALGAAEGLLRSGLGQIFAVAEAYPELRANEHFKQLQNRISVLEGGIADRRELYNEAVNLHNVRIEQFPDLFIARLFGFVEQSLLQFGSAEKVDVDLKALFRA